MRSDNLATPIHTYTIHQHMCNFLQTIITHSRIESSTHSHAIMRRRYLDGVGGLIKPPMQLVARG